MPETSRSEYNGTPDGTFHKYWDRAQRFVTGVGFSDDSIIVTGEFTHVDGATSKGVARFGPWLTEPGLLQEYRHWHHWGGAVAVQPGDQSSLPGSSLLASMAHSLTVSFDSPRVACSTQVSPRIQHRSTRLGRW